MTRRSKSTRIWRTTGSLRMTKEAGTEIGGERHIIQQQQQPFLLPVFLVPRRHFQRADPKQIVDRIQLQGKEEVVSIDVSSMLLAKEKASPH
jgi:hypothetical protein